MNVRAGELSNFHYLGFDHRGEETVYWGPQIKQLAAVGEQPVMSLRLSTGIMGFTDCPAGDGKGIPKGPNEVLIGVGELGVQRLVELGGMPCVACESGAALAAISPAVTELLSRRLGGDISHAVDVSYLTSGVYDANKLTWLTIFPLLQLYKLSGPGRLYVRAGIEQDEVKEIRDLFSTYGFPVPAIGWFDKVQLSRNQDPFTPYP